MPLPIDLTTQALMLKAQGLQNELTSQSYASAPRISKPHLAAIVCLCMLFLAALLLLIAGVCLEGQTDIDSRARETAKAMAKTGAILSMVVLFYSLALLVFARAQSRSRPGEVWGTETKSSIQMVGDVLPEVFLEGLTTDRSYALDLQIRCGRCDPPRSSYHLH
ncbi:hypothetical protein K431DRAFT_88925 [Polychaeton citri CBS 116435]|uniref:Uncharacterized protein n=1 Tax=Polychaeton citri CBS 116435 TaxID=1314669 RepID=A0A9P4UPF3_9PEZI|nr:hypothetical protein K431DRAFT_88925 [Polychaeton citri CBS 116435]